MKVRPILFSTPMVQALLEGRKTQTRRIIKPQPSIVSNGIPMYPPKSTESSSDWPIRCPYGILGDLLYVRETLGLRTVINHTTNKLGIVAYYKASSENEVFTWNGKSDTDVIPSIYMPRWASRLTLEITNIKVERLQDISEEDAIAEGLTAITKDGGQTIKYGIPDSDGYPGTDNTGWPWHEWEVDPRKAYKKLWESINGKESWNTNPWVWVVEFKVHKCNVDKF